MTRMMSRGTIVVETPRTPNGWWKTLASCGHVSGRLTVIRPDLPQDGSKGIQILFRLLDDPLCGKGPCGISSERTVGKLCQLCTSDPLWGTARAADSPRLFPPVDPTRCNSKRLTYESGPFHVRGLRIQLTHRVHKADPHLASCVPAGPETHQRSQGPSRPDGP